MRIINLTQHPSTPEQRADGVFDLTREKLAELKRNLEFTSLPNEEEILPRGVPLCRICACGGVTAESEPDDSKHKHQATVGNRGGVR